MAREVNGMSFVYFRMITGIDEARRKAEESERLFLSILRQHEEIVRKMVQPYFDAKQKDHTDFAVKYHKMFDFDEYLVPAAHSGWRGGGKQIKLR